MFLLFFIFFTPAGNAPHLSSPNELFRLKEYLSLQRNETELLVNSTWRHIPGNLTGVRPYPKQKVEHGNEFLPPEVLDLANEIWHSEATIKKEPDGHDDHPTELEERDLFNLDLPEVPVIGDKPLVFYHNISGVYEGEWNQMKDAKNLIPRNMTIAEVFQSPTTALIYGQNVTIRDLDYMEFGFIGAARGNMTKEQGRTLLTITELPSRNASRNVNANVTMVTMNVAVLDQIESQRFSVELRGFHFIPTGNMLLTTASLKFSGFQFLPHLMLEDTYFNEARGLMAEYLNTTFTAYEKALDFETFQEADMEADNCEYIVYGHVQSVPLSKQELQDVENEYKNPVGRPLRKIPGLKLSTVFYSPDCAVGITCDKILGEKYESYWSRIRIAILCGVVLLLAQMFLLARQMRDTNTPSLMLKISFISISMMAVVDGTIWMASFASFFVEVLALPFMAVAFLSFALTSMFEMRYMVKIYQSQLPEAIADARVRQATQTNGQSALYAMPDGSIVASQTASRNSASPPATESDLLPAPATAPNPAAVPIPTLSEADTSERAIAGMLYSRFYFALLIFIITSLIASTWSIQYRIMYEYVLVLGFYSVWIPQIYRNITRGFRKSFLWSFIVGTSIIRLIPLMYVCLYKNNVGGHHYDPLLALLSVCWVCVQIAILAAQNMFGARFFLPRGYLPVLYDYHPVLYEGDAESELGIDVSSAGQQLPRKPSIPTIITTAPDEGSLSSDKNITTEDSDESSTKPLLQAHSEQQVLRPHVDCAICMMPVELIITPRGAGSQITSSPVLMLARRRYMVTPCQHVFHTECMERWMRSRLQCPICRNPLPPL